MTSLNIHAIVDLERNLKLEPVLHKMDLMFLGDRAGKTPPRCSLFCVSCECMYF